MSIFVESLRGLSLAVREAAQLKRGPDPVTFTPVRVSDRLTIFATTDAFRWDGVYLPVSAQLQARLCKARGTVQPVARIEDAIWAAARLQINPHPDPAAVAAGTMHKLPAALAHGDKLEAARAGRCGLIRGWKSWVLDKRLETTRSRAVNYGWHALPGWSGAPLIPSEDGQHRLVQGRINDLSRAHFVTHSDYSQLGTEYQDRAILDGQEVSLVDLLAGRIGGSLAAELGGPYAHPFHPGAASHAAPRPGVGMPNVTQIGQQGSAVTAWQRWLLSWNASALPRWGADGDHGQETETWTQAYMEAHGVMRDGAGGVRPIPGPGDLVIVPRRVEPASFLQARYYYAGRAMGPAIWIVVHTAQTIEANYAAESLQRYAHTMADGRQVSWHAAGDSDSITESVRLHHTAFAAPGANQLGFHFELAGSAFQTPQQWADGFTSSALELASGYLADMADQLKIPTHKITVDQMLDLEPGFVGHLDVRDACIEARRRGLKRAPWWRADRGSWAHTSHGDPGPDFPWRDFMAAVRAA